MFRVVHAQFITLVDFRHGYWQVQMDLHSQVLAAFVTHEGQYARTVMLFGLKNSIATFQRMTIHSYLSTKPMPLHIEMI